MNHEGAGQSHERESESQRAPSLGLLVNLAKVHDKASQGMLVERILMRRREGRNKEKSDHMKDTVLYEM